MQKMSESIGESMVMGLTPFLSSEEEEKKTFKTTNVYESDASHIFSVYHRILQGGLGVLTKNILTWADKGGGGGGVLT